MNENANRLRARRMVEDWRDLHDADRALNVTRTTAVVAEAIERSPVRELSADQVHAICSRALELAKALEADRLAYLRKLAPMARLIDVARHSPRERTADDHLPSPRRMNDAFFRSIDHED